MLAKCQDYKNLSWILLSRSVLTDNKINGDPKGLIFWSNGLQNFLKMPRCDITQGQLSKKKLRKIAIIFLFINLNMCFGYSIEPSWWDISFEYPQHMFWLRNKKNNFQLHTLIWGPDITWWCHLISHFHLRKMTSWVRLEFISLVNPFPYEYSC